MYQLKVDQVVMVVAVVEVAMVTQQSIQKK
jgi:hypothetical protein